ncbi:MAG: uncharacterized protein HW386_125 [Gammaproteobacteria bacterium]|nr:uncharacterized protein [Gammaproteobacteria bacterium]
MARYLPLCFSLIFLSVALPASAEQSKTFGAYTVHYNAFTTNSLSPEIAKLYNIKRSNNRALLNVSILKQDTGAATKPVKARVTATATNMNSQLNQLTVRELIEAGEPDAIYYLAETTVNNGDMLTYNVSLTPDGESESYSFNFQQQFITE